MTRINVGISIKQLTDEHLLAEHREIKRLPNIFQRCLKEEKGCNLKDRIPNKFVLGRGHVLFFMDKFKYTYDRYKQIHYECIRRGFSVEDYSKNWKRVTDFYFNDYEVSDEDRSLLMERISDRILNSTKSCFHYYGKRISREEAVELLKK